MMVKPNGTVKHSTAHYGRDDIDLYHEPSNFHGEGHRWDTGDVALWKNYQTGELSSALYCDGSWSYPDDLTDFALSLGIREYTEANAQLFSSHLINRYHTIPDYEDNTPPPWLEPVDPDKVVNFGVF